ncbi:chlorophyll synthase, chloroplastic-like [Henckelia pumila]|uniref:chlorophyll synthase, chloroplastic-like n=1 Tax=Henckelia pumila TaxID=405737 RepID=UPI003C6DC3AE
MMPGPCLTGYTQTLNDWYDREIDAINEPYRPLPSGAISENEVITQIWVLLLACVGLAGLLYLKRNGWIGNFSLGASYISLLWWAGQALFGTLTLDNFILTLLYSIAGFGIAIVNDFKSVEGDRKMGRQMAGRDDESHGSIGGRWGGRTRSGNNVRGTIASGVIEYV